MSTCRCRRDAPHPGSFGGDHATPHYPPNLELEPVHLDISLTLDLPAEVAKAVVKTTAVARKEGVRTLTLDGIDFLELAVVGPADVSADAPALAYDGKKSP